MRRILFFIILLLTANICFANVFDVPGDALNIQAGIDLAISGDTVLVADGTYTGAGNRDIDFGGKNIVVMSENGPEATIIDCQGSESEPHRGFNFINDETSEAKLIGFSVINGYGPYTAGHSHYDGGAILIDGASPSIEYCIFNNNDGDHQGGAVCCFSSTSTFTNCTFTNNKATFGGGLYANDAHPTLYNCIFASNENGGAVNCYDGGTVELHCSNLFDNIGGDYVGCASGQLYNNGNISVDPQFCDPDLSDFSLTNTSPCLAANNSCGELIGALDHGCTPPVLGGDTYYVFHDGSGDALTIQAAIDLTISNDTVIVGDGTYTGEGNRDINYDGKNIVVMSINGPETTIIDCQGTKPEPHRGFNFINGETSSAKLIGFSIINGYGPYTNDHFHYEGGALLIVGTSPTIEYCIFSNNDGDHQGGAVCCFYSMPTFTNCTFVNNTATFGGGLYSNQAHPILYNCLFLSNDNGGAVNCYDGGTVELYCSNLYNNAGGNFGDCALGQQDVNDNIVQDPEFCDFDNNDFHLANTSPCLASNNSCGKLIGALGQNCTSSVIYNRTFYVYNNGSGDVLTIQEAIDLTIPGDTVLVGSGTYTGEGNRDLDYYGKDIVVMSENGPDVTIINCEGSESEPHRGFNFINGETSEAKLIGFSVINGYGPYTPDHHHYDGGAILIIGASPSIEYCIFNNNDGDHQGGAVCTFFSTSTFTNCTFTNNKATFGGGLYANDAHPTLYNCIFASNDDGGAVNCYNGGTVELHCSNLFDNIGGDYVDCASGQLGVNGNFSEDPLFCDFDNSDFGLMRLSPCAENNNECNILIGALPVKCGGYVCGDANGDGSAALSDAVYIINYVFVGGNEPYEYYSGDCNCDGKVNITDAVYIINYIFLGGHQPCDTNGDGEPDC